MRKDILELKIKEIAGFHYYGDGIKFSLHGYNGHPWHIEKKKVLKIVSAPH